MDYKINKDQIEDVINKASYTLYKKHKNLIDEAAHEDMIVADVIAPYLRSHIEGYSVSTGYNREGPLDNRQTKTGLDEKPILPDIIIHKFGPNGPNIAAVEVKGWWNKEDREEDESSLRNLGAKHGYRYLYRLELGKNKHELIPVYMSEEGQNLN